MYTIYSMILAYNMYNIYYTALVPSHVFLVGAEASDPLAVTKAVNVRDFITVQPVVSIIKDN